MHIRAAVVETVPHEKTVFPVPLFVQRTRIVTVRGAFPTGRLVEGQLMVEPNRKEIAPFAFPKWSAAHEMPAGDFFTHGEKDAASASWPEK